MTKDMIQSIVSAKTRYEYASRNKMGVNAAKEQLKTIMFNCYPDLVYMLQSEEVSNAVNSEELDDLRRKVKSLTADLESLQMALQDADEENDAMRKELNSLKQTRKGKTKAADVNGEA